MFDGAWRFHHGSEEGSEEGSEDEGPAGRAEVQSVPTGRTQCAHLRGQKVIAAPCGNRLLLRLAEVAERKTEAGVIIPDTANSSPLCIAHVVATGPGEAVEFPGETRTYRVPPAKVGDRVLIMRGCGFELPGSGPKQVIVNGQDILAIV